MVGTHESTVVGTNQTSQDVSVRKIDVSQSGSQSQAVSPVVRRTSCTRHLRGAVDHEHRGGQILRRHCQGGSTWAESVGEMCTEFRGCGSRDCGDNCLSDRVENCGEKV